MLANLTDSTHNADGALILGVVFGPVKRTLLVCGTAVNGAVAGRADFKLSELVKFDLDGIVGVALALSLGTAGLGMFC